MRALEKIGAYNPKSNNLTKARKKEIRRRFRAFENFLLSDRYIHVPLRSKKHRKSALELAAQNELATSPKGIFVERTRATDKVRAKYDRKTGQYNLIVTRTKKGATGEATTTEIIPIAPMGALADELARIHHDAAALGPLGKDETIAFKVTVNGADGYSHNIYADPEALINDLEIRYEAMPPWFKGQFFRSISVMKVSRRGYQKAQRRLGRNPYARADKTGRSKIAPIEKRKVKVEVKKTAEGWGVFVNGALFEIWPTRGRAIEAARELRYNLNH
jgi:hypothetical protein